MASLWKHPKSRYWTACFTDSLGRRRKRSTKETNRKKAEMIAIKLEDAARKKRTFKQVKSIIEDLRTEITGERANDSSLRDFVTTWLSEKADETKKSSMQTYQTATKKFLASLGAKADENMTEITRNDIMAFRKSMVGNISATSVNHNLKCIKMLFKAARKNQIIEENPAETVDTVRKASVQKRRPFTQEELQLTLNAADPEWKSMILFGLYTGQRLSDIAGLTWANIDFDREELHFTTAKTGRSMNIPLAVPLQKHLDSLPKAQKPTAPLHPNAYATVTKVGKTTTLSNQFADILANAGLRKPVEHSKKKEGRESARDQNELSFHCLRHTAVSLLKDAGIPDATVMEMIGHSSLQMSQRYTHVGKEALVRAVASLPNLEEKQPPIGKSRRIKLQGTSTLSKNASKKADA